MDTSFVVLSAAVLAVLSLVAGGVAIVGSILYRATLRRKEIATLRVLGARRTHIARMLLSENVLGLLAGIGVGILGMLSVARLHHSWFLTALLSSAVLVVAVGLVGGWLAGRHAAKVPFSASGLFRTSSDTRGHS